MPTVAPSSEMSKLPEPNVGEYGCETSVVVFAATSRTKMSMFVLVSCGTRFVAAAAECNTRAVTAHDRAERAHVVGRAAGSLGDERRRGGGEIALVDRLEPVFVRRVEIRGCGTERHVRAVGVDARSEAFGVGGRAFGPFARLTSTVSPL